jgi:hypothetical protein
MEANTSYLAVAQDYAEGVRALLAIKGASTGERGEGGPGSPAALAAQAEKLAPLSSSLTAEAANKLSAADPDLRAHASSQLLAKALTDLKVSTQLLQAAVDEEEGRSWDSGARERSLVDAGATDDLLQIIVGKTPATLLSYERGEAAAPKDIASARIVLSQSIEDTLALVSNRTSKTGQAAVGGLFGIGLGQVGQAAGLLGQNIAQVLGQADKLSRLYNLFRDFAFKAYESVVALLGPAAAKIVGQQVMTWLGEVKEASFFSKLLEKMYQTKQTQEALLPIVKQSNADQAKFMTAIEEVEKLGQACTRQTDLVDKLLRGIKYLGAVPVAVLPYGALLMAAIYVAICGYVVLNGADYVDADQIRLLKRMPGVRRVVVANL